MAFDMNNLVLAVEDDSSSYVQQPGWLCDFNFGYGCDVIEEDALNEKYCIQVLRILITKEDSEIDQLEKDLVSLQSELAWFKYEEWSDICCNALRRNIDSLRTSLTSLKSNDIEVHLSIKPAESLHEIMKALLSDLFPEEIKQNEQPLDVVVVDSSDSRGQPTEDLGEKKKSCNSGSDDVMKEEMEEFSITPVGSGSESKASLTVQGDETNNSETVKHVSDFRQNPLELAAGHPHQESIEYKDARKGEGKEHDFTPKKNRIAPDLPMKSADERRQNLELVEVQIDYEQPAEINLKNSSRNALKQAVTYCKRKKPLNISDFKIIKAAKDQKSAADVLILDSSLNPIEKSANISKKVKPANAIMQQLRAGALRYATGLDGRRNNSDSKLVTSGQAKGGNSNANSNGLRHPSGLIGRRNNSDPELATSRQVKVENAGGSPAALRHATGLNQRRNNRDSWLGAVMQENGGNCDINQKLCDFALKVARKRNIKQPNVTQADKRDSPSSEAEGSKRHSQMVVKVEKVDLTDTKNSNLTSIVELQNGKGKDAAKKLPEEGTMQLELQLAENFANNEKVNLDLSVKSQNQKAKRKTESSSPNIQEPVPSPAEVVSNAPSISKAKMQCKAGLGSDSSISKDTASQLPEEGTMQLELQLAKNFANNEKSTMGLSVKSQNQKAMRKTESSSPNIQEPVPFPAEVVSDAPSISKAKMQCKAGLGSDSSISKDTAKKLPEEGTMQLELQLAENFANNEKFSLDLSVKSQNKKAKRKTESSLANVQEPISFPVKMVSNAPSISKAKMQCKAGFDKSVSNQSWDRKTMKKKSRSSQYEGEENSSAMKDCQINLQPQKKKRKNSGLPIVVEIKGSTLQLDSSKSQSNPNDRTGKDDLSITESYAIVPYSEAVPSAASILKDLKVGDLRAIAKENKLTKYYKLRKSDLIEQIAKHLRC